MSHAVHDPNIHDAATFERQPVVTAFSPAQDRDLPTPYPTSALEHGGRVAREDWTPRFPGLEALFASQFVRLELR